MLFAGFWAEKKETMGNHKQHVCSIRVQLTLIKNNCATIQSLLKQKK